MFPDGDGSRRVGPDLQSQSQRQPGCSIDDRLYLIGGQHPADLLSERLSHFGSVRRRDLRRLVDGRLHALPARLCPTRP